MIGDTKFNYIEDTFYWSSTFIGSVDNREIMRALHFSLREGKGYFGACRECSDRILTINSVK